MYLFVIAVVLVLFNTTFLEASRDMIFVSKESFVQAQVSLVARSIEEGVDVLDEENISRIITQLEGLAEHIYVVITDYTGRVLYDPGGSHLRPDFPSAHILRAVEGYDLVYTRFADGAFGSSAFTPVVIGGAVIGAVFVHEEDSVQGEILIEMQETLRNISIIVIVFTVAMILVTLWFVMRRITSILKAIVSVREGEYSYKVSMSGNDELALLGDEFNSLTERLRQTDEIRRDFVANASHELKTPLATIRLLSDSILQNEGIEREKVQEFILDINIEAERLTRTTEKLMALTRLDSHLPLYFGPIDLRDAVNAVFRRLRSFADSRGVTLKSDLNEYCIVLASDDSVDQIMYNLVENAIKYNKPDGMVIVRLKIDEDEMVVLTVDDTGIGVPQEDMAYIFDRFYRVDKARSRDAGGSGLGLSIVKDTVRELNGKVTAQQRAEGGMRFEVRLPRVLPDEFDER